MLILTREAAMAASRKRFFTGVACVNGHLCERRVCDKKCVICARDVSIAAAKKRPEAVAAAKAKYRNANREQLRIAYAEYCAQYAEKVREQKRAYAARNREKERRRSIAKFRANPAAYRVWRNNRRLRLAARKIEGSFTAEDVHRIFKQQRGKCAYCPVRLGSRYHIDHIQPLAADGTNLPRNIQLCCPRCNLSKSKRDPIEFARSLGMLL